MYNGIAYSYKKRRELCYMTMQDVVHQLFADSVWEEFALLNHAVSDSEIMHILQYLDLIEYKDNHYKQKRNTAMYFSTNPMLCHGNI